MELVFNLILRWAHVIFGIAWIGLLYYFNFVQTEYFKEAEPDAKADATKKLAPRALWWFRWAAMGTFLTGVVFLGLLGSSINSFLIVGAVAGTLMFLNVWLIIWPNQKIVIGLAAARVGDLSAGGSSTFCKQTILFLPRAMCRYHFHLDAVGCAHLHREPKQSSHGRLCFRIERGEVLLRALVEFVRDRRTLLAGPGIDVERFLERSEVPVDGPQG